MDSITGPSRYEHDTEEADMDKDDLWGLKEEADDANDEGSTSSYVSLATYILWFVDGDAGQIESTVANLLSSRLDAYGTLEYAFNEYRYLDTHSDVSSVPTMIPLERFWSGADYISDWYSCKHP